MKFKRFEAGMCFLLFLCWHPQGANAQVPCQPGTAPSGAVYICDPLTGSTVATARHGGSLTAEGFVANGNNDSLEYDLGIQLTEFCLEFDVKGIDGSYQFLFRDNYHILDMVENTRVDFDECGLSLRIYGCDPNVPEYCNPPESDPSGSVKLKIWGNGDNDEPFTRNDIGWDPDHWYHMRVVSQGGATTWFRDGSQVVRSANTGAFQPHYGRVWLPNDGWVAYFTIPGSTYQNFMISSAPDCSIPQCGQACDDGNPCTTGDVLPCPSGACLGTLLADGTACDDGDPETSDSTCRGGICAADCDLPDPAGIVIDADHTVSVLYPDQNYPDATTLDVERAADGSVEAIAYLKVQVDLAPDLAIESAALQLYCDSLTYPQAAEGNGGDLHLVPDNNWSEATLTWNGKPSWSSQVIFSQGPIERGNWYAFNVSSVVTTSGTYSFALLPNANNGGHYLSREGGIAGCYQPYLTLQTSGCGTACDDGNACTDSDAIDCQSGQCAGAPVADGTPCDDGDLATTGDACRQGVCRGSTGTDARDGMSDGGGDGDVGVDAGDGGGDEASSDAGGDLDAEVYGGCDCDAGGGPPGAAGLLLLVLVLVLSLGLRRRQDAHG